MPFLLPNQQRQSTEGNNFDKYYPASWGLSRTPEALDPLEQLP